MIDDRDLAGRSPRAASPAITRRRSDDIGGRASLLGHAAGSNCRAADPPKV